MIYLILAIAVGLILFERLYPSMALPKVENWWGRIIFCNTIQLLIIIFAGLTWDRWFQGYSLFKLQNIFSPSVAALIAYFVSTFIYYWWHRFRHESQFFWRLCHQLHHSARRIEIVTSFYKHPVEILLNSFLSALIVYALFGLSTEAGAFYTLLTAIAEFFYHWNINTPHWIGYVIQRPESHRIHHKYQHHTQNFADLPIWDMLFGTFNNPTQFAGSCGYDDWREDRFEDMLAFRDVNAQNALETRPLEFLPICIGCRKRWACASTKDEGTNKH
jgi:sterol desaturase/sphingolipid hydroxylase (fatty acid hydroxylase superfamily)